MVSLDFMHFKRVTTQYTSIDKVIMICQNERELRLGFIAPAGFTRILGSRMLYLHPMNGRPGLRECMNAWMRDLQSIMGCQMDAGWRELCR